MPKLGDENNLKVHNVTVVYVITMFYSNSVDSSGKVDNVIYPFYFLLVLGFAKIVALLTTNSR